MAIGILWRFECDPPIFGLKDGKDLQEDIKTVQTMWSAFGKQLCLVESLKPDSPCLYCMHQDCFWHLLCVCTDMPLPSIAQIPLSYYLRVKCLATHALY